MAVVVFNAEEFRSLYPQCAEGLSNAQLNEAFEQATLFLPNTDKSPVPYNPEQGENTRKTLLYFLLAHQATISLWGKNGQNGPIASASEGTVSVSFTNPLKAGDAYFMQSVYGHMYLKALRPYITGGHYVTSSRQHPWG